MTETKSIKLPEVNKLHKGSCIVCEKEENCVVPMVVFPNGNFAHLICYPIELKIY